MKYDMKITLFLVALFMLSQVVGLSFIINHIQIIQTPEGSFEAFYPDTALGERPEVEGGEAVLFVLSGVFLGTILLLLIIRFAKVNYWKILFFIAVITTVTIALGVFLTPVYAFIIAFILTMLKIFRSNLFFHNLTELLIYSGIAVLFVPLFSIEWIILLLFFISAYDMFAVWKSKHMIKLAQFQTGSKLFAGLMISLEGRKSKANVVKSKTAKRVKGKVKAGKVRVREAILGGGDIAFPLIFSGVVMESLIVGATKEAAFLKTLIIPLVLSIVLFTLLLKGKQGKFYPAMPFMTIGCLIGWGLILLV